MGMLVLAGEGFNYLAGQPFSSTPAADANAPFSNLGDNRPGLAGRFGTLTDIPFVTSETDLLRRDGDFEVISGGVFAGFTEDNALGGDVTQELTLVVSGAGAAKFTTGAPSSRASHYTDRKVRVGDRIYLNIWIRGDAGSGSLKLRIRNLETGNYLQSGGPDPWAAAASNVIVGGGTGGPGPHGYSQDALIFDVETYAQCRGPRCTLRFTLTNDVTASSSYADAFTASLACNFLAVFGHNIDPRSVCQLRGSNDKFTSGDILVSEQPVRQPAWYHRIDPFLEGFFSWRLRFVGPNEGSGRIAMGEWVMGRAIELAQPPGYPIVRSFRDPQVRGSLPYGGPYSVGVGPTGRPPVGLQLTFRQGDDAAEEFINEVILRSSGGHPLVIVPDDTKPDVYFGKISPDWETRREQFASHDSTLVLEPMPFPLLLP